MPYLRLRFLSLSTPAMAGIAQSKPDDERPPADAIQRARVQPHVLNAGRLHLAAFLQGCEATSLLQLLFARLALGLLALGVGQAGARLGEHLLLILVHVDRVRPRGLRLGVRVDFAGPQAAWVFVGQVVVRAALRLVPSGDEGDVKGTES